MSNSLPLEDFEASVAPASGESAGPPSREQLEATERSAYERGYAAGWDDALRAEQEAQSHISAELARNLQDLGFTFHEARNHVMRAIEPFLEELLKKFLPKLAHGSVPGMVHEVLMPVVESGSDAPIDLTVPVGTKKLVDPFVASVKSAPVRVVEEPSLTDGQAILRSGIIESQVDLSEAIERITQARDDLYAQSRKSDPDGQLRQPQTNAL